MVTKDEARWELIEAAKTYTAALDELKTIESLPEAIIEGKSLQAVIAPLTSRQFVERLENLDKAWTRYRNAWLAFLHYADK
ncbi:MAG TPA: hypothetical protein G4O10_02960 [Dehalococcoidia bacterium]|nr:hypothetical protein [Dehalococcoidia bacterium]